MSYRKCTYPVVFAFEEHPSGVLRRTRSEPQHFPRAVVALYERHRQATKTLHERRARWTAGRVRRADELAPACGDAPLPGLRERLPDHSIAWGSNRRPKKPNPAPAMKCRRSANPAACRCRGKGGEASCAWRPSGVLMPAAFAGILGGGWRRREGGEERWLVGESAG